MTAESEAANTTPTAQQPQAQQEHEEAAPANHGEGIDSGSNEQSDGDGHASAPLAAAAATPTDDKTGNSTDDGLEGLSELVPDLKSRKNSLEHTNGMVLTEPDAAAAGNAPGDSGNSHSRQADVIKQMDSMAVQDGGAAAGAQPPNKQQSFVSANMDEVSSSSDDNRDEDSKDVNEILYGTGNDGTPADDANSDQALEDDNSQQSSPRPPDEFGGGNIDFSGAQSLTTATQTHEIRMPMYLPNFKPATGCTNASDFIVRCFAARLRSGITVVKHGRSRWCKSRLRILHIHPDGKSLSWKPAQGEPTSSKRPPKLDLTQCLEVRHAWSPDPQNPMYTGTPILRQKCEAANAHKSFALIFPKRTVDITSVTADQCKVLMEGFSALCFRLQVANFAARGGKEDEVEREAERDTASVTLTNNSTIMTSPNNPIRAARRQ